MKQYKLNIGLVLASVSTLLVLAVVPAYAVSSDLADAPDTTTATPTDDVSQGAIHSKAAMFRQKGKEKLQQARENHSTLKATKRQMVCEHIQNAVNHKLVAFNNHASTYLTRLNNVFTKLQAYQTTNNLPVSNYNDLVTAATTAQTNATVAVDALNSLGSTLDCTSSDPGAMLSSAKEGATSARDSLKAYHTTLKNIVVALAHAQSSNGDSTDTSTTEGN
jgi:hypothetical protein